ncbi:MAG: hypothetical protein AAB309_04900, partial [Deltaproteobacteria bacterium]
MKFHKFCFFFFFYLSVVGYGEDRQHHFLSQGESIHLIEMGFVSANVKARIEWVAETRKDQEIIYHPRKKKVSSRDVELRDHLLYFRRPGEYLVEFIREDQTKEIRIIKVVPNQDSGIGTFGDPFKDIHLYAFRDAFYKTIFHLELRFVRKGDWGSRLPPPPNVSWEISGGRHHVLDDELPYFSKIRAFQKSVVLKEFGSYEAKAYVSLSDGGVLERSVTINLQPEASNTPLLATDTQLLSFPINKPVRVFVQNSLSNERYQYAWRVKAVHHPECLQEWLELEDADNFSVRGILHYICDNGYEEELVAERDYLLSKQDIHKAEF